jgi:hypothetical protein
MLFKSVFVLLAVFSFQIGFGLKCYNCVEDQKNPSENRGGSCFSPNSNTTIDSEPECAYCAVAISRESDEKGNVYSSVLF